MDNKISEIISQCLFTFGKVSIPGFGSFSISDSSSGFVLKDHVITPPAQLVEFSEDAEDDNGLVEFLISKHSYSKEDAESEVSSFSKSLLNNLLNYGFVEVPKIGKLSKLATNEIVFEPNEDYINLENYALPSLKLSPIIREEVVGDDIAGKAIAPAAATVAAFTPEKSVEESVPAEVEKIAEPVKEVAAPVVETNTTAQESTYVAPEPKTEIVKEVPPPVVYEDETSLGVKLGCPLLVLVIALFGFLLYKGCQGTKLGDMGISNPLKQSTATDTVQNTSEKEITDLDSWIAANPKLSKFADVLTEDNMKDGCVIVVGSFKKSRNAIRMRDRLIKDGYSPYTETHQGLNRVGLLFQCQDHDLAGYIDTIRREYDRGAWYLSPELVVPR